ncbi:hypothetical protein GTW51_10300 [Aurantimonas aggregata]|uniref:Uncharacterized protein n=1 Tax=Aurantimonas aggregata TaxID=2047720 RepID=A0A6L9MHQ8_9HYPH|nr:hypothetical protein [Aurantimonas aggregata]NDV87092.1 hypothetical protein [Aurantimonas aggregata]
MTDDERPRTPKPTREERLQEQLRANLKRRKEQARARREPRKEGVLPGDSLPATGGETTD